MWEFYIFMWEFSTLNLYIPSVFIVLRYGLKKMLMIPKINILHLAFLLITWGKSPISSKMPL